MNVFLLLLSSIAPMLVGTDKHPASLRIRLEEAIHAALAPYRVESRQAHVQLIRIPDALPETGSFQIHWRSSKRPTGRTQIEIWYRSSSQAPPERIGYAMIEVTWFDSVMVAMESLSKNQHLSPSSLKPVWMDITHFSGEPLRPSDFRKALTQQHTRVARLIRAGKPLRISDLLPPLAADTGDTVILEVKRNHFSIMMPCTARQPGSVGDIIRVYCPDTDRHYRAQLTNQQKALWVQTIQ